MDPLVDNLEVSFGESFGETYLKVHQPLKTAVEKQLGARCETESLGLLAEDAVGPPKQKFQNKRRRSNLRRKIVMNGE